MFLYSLTFQQCTAIVPKMLHLISKKFQKTFKVPKIALFFLHTTMQCFFFKIIYIYIKKRELVIRYQEHAGGRACHIGTSHRQNMRDEVGDGLTIFRAVGKILSSTHIAIKKVDKKNLLTLCKKKIKLYICRLFEVESAVIKLLLKYYLSTFYIYV